MSTQPWHPWSCQRISATRAGDTTSGWQATHSPAPPSLITLHSPLSTTATASTNEPRSRAWNPAAYCTPVHSASHPHTRHSTLAPGIEYALQDFQEPHLYIIVKQVCTALYKTQVIYNNNTNGGTDANQFFSSNRAERVLRSRRHGVPGTDAACRPASSHGMLTTANHPH